ncbi:UDP-4-amino-4-deoxy-L-arabinose--oxoglutarate aminotransferase [uncultured archaeon]|nr:UDP-4-amino-4-deoxy-L-arabinose--oxoglutarate aminotransferase [uncultured archaeon]
MKHISVGDFKIGAEEKRAINDVLENGRISENTKVREFEKLFAEYIGTKYSISVNSGTSALIAGMKAMLHNESIDVMHGTNVVTTPLTYIATSGALVNTGFNPVYIDVDMDTFVITPEKIKEHLEGADGIEKYSFILPVHLMGYPCDMDVINKIGNTYGLQVFEDSSQAHGTVYKGKKTGSMSLLSCFSFYIAHNIQAGEMGAITTDNPDIVRLVRKIKANGRMCDCPVCKRSLGKCPKLTNYKGDDDFDPRFTHEFIGYNFKTMEFQAALGITQLKKEDWIKERRSYNVKYLNEGLEKYSYLLKLPKFDKDVSYIAYPLVIKNPDKLSRKKLRKKLEEKGIETRPLFGCIPTQQPAFEYMKEEYENMLPNAEYLGKNAFYIGCHQYLGQDDLDYIIEIFGSIISDNGVH